MGYNNKKQQGASLIMVLAIMIVIALMVITTGKSTNVEVRTSADDADKKVAYMMAETALLLAEQQADEHFKDHTNTIETTISNNHIAYFPPKLATQMALAKNKDKVAWEVDNVFYGNKKDLLAEEIKDKKDKTLITTNETQAQPRYIVEYFGTQEVKARVTVKAWGQSENNSTMLQSIIQLN